MVETVDSINLWNKTVRKSNINISIKSILGTKNFNMSNSTDPMSSSSNNSATPSEYDYNVPVEVVVTIFFIILFVNLIGNSIVVLVVVKKRRMQTFTNWLILNLSIADLLVAVICITLEIPLEIRGGVWIYGSIFCSLFYPIQTSTIYGSVFTLLSLSVSRYWAIIHPFRRQPTIFVAKFLIGVIWLASIVVVIPYMNVLKYEKEKCFEDWTPKEQRRYTVVLFTFQFVLPIIIISIAYTFIIYELSYKKESRSTTLTEMDKMKRRESKKVVKLLLIITITFVICILPYHMIALINEFSGSDYAYVNDIILASYIMLYLNSALNPILYNVFNENFREAFNELYKTVIAYLTNRTNSLERNFFSDRRPSMFDQSIWERYNMSRTTTVLSENDSSTSRRNSLYLPRITNNNISMKFPKQSISLNEDIEEEMETQGFI